MSSARTTDAVDGSRSGTRFVGADRPGDRSAPPGSTHRLGPTPALGDSWTSTAGGVVQVGVVGDPVTDVVARMPSASPLLRLGGARRPDDRQRRRIGSVKSVINRLVTSMSPEFADVVAVQVGEQQRRDNPAAPTPSAAARRNTPRPQSTKRPARRPAPGWMARRGSGQG